MAKSKPIQSPSMRRFDDDTVDLRSYVGRGGFGSEFNEAIDQNQVPFQSNAHDEREYESMKRLPDQKTYIDRLDENGMYAGMQRVISDPPMSIRVKNQVMDSIGARTGTMTSASLLDRSKGVGEYGDEGGLRSRAQVRPNDLLINKPTNPKGRW